MAHAKLACIVPITVLLAAGCGSKTPTSPTGTPVGQAVQTVAVQSGAWKGAFDITSCSGGRFGFGCPRSPENFMLRLGTDGAGVLQIQSGMWGGLSPIPVNVTATPSASGGILVTGSNGPTGKSLQVELTLADLSASLQGSIHYAVDNGVGDRIVNDGRVLFATRDNTIYLGRFQGNWIGYVERTQCSGDCSEWDPVWVMDGIDLALSQAGSGVSGTISSFFPLTGTAAGDSLTGSVHFAIPAEQCRRGFDSGTVCAVELTLSAIADSLDRLHGSVTYHAQGVSNSNKPYALDATTSLEGIVRWPQ